MPEPFIDPQSRPDLTVDLNAKVGDLSVRQLSDILGSSAPRKQKDSIKDGIKDGIKEIKEIEKIQKDHPDKFPAKEHKEAVDQKNTKDHKDTADHKATKDHKESADTKNSKDHKDHLKDHKEVVKEIIKEHFKEKDQIVDNNKSLVVDNKGPKEQVENGPVIVNPGDPVFTAPQGIDQLIQRLSGLEQQVAALQGGGATEGGQG